MEQSLGKTILFTDILGFAYDTRNPTVQFEGMLKQLDLFLMVKNLSSKYANIISFAFSDTVVAVSDDNEQVFNFAKELFRQAWDTNICLRGAIACGEFYDLSNTQSLTNAPKNFITMPIIGYGYTKAARMEKKAPKGCRLFIDRDITIPLYHRNNIRFLENNEVQDYLHLQPYTEYIWWNPDDQGKCSNGITVTELKINQVTQDKNKAQGGREVYFDKLRDAEISYEIDCLQKKLEHLHKTLEIMSK